MRDDEMSHRRLQGQNIFANEIELDSNVQARLQGFMKDANKKFANAKTLSPKHVAAIRADFEKTYIFYGQLSSDAAHPSITALNRYILKGTPEEPGGIDIEPELRDGELCETLEYLCMAAVGVCVGVNQIIGTSNVDVDLSGIADRYIDLSNRVKAPKDAA